MSFYKSLSATLVVAACWLAGCAKDDAASPNVCMSGRIVGLTCMDGILIDVDPAYGLGAPARSHRLNGDTLLGQHVIAVVNTMDYARLATVGLTLHFNAVNDPSRQDSGVRCLAADGVQGPVPRVVLSNVSTTACQAGPL